MTVQETANDESGGKHKLLETLLVKQYLWEKQIVDISGRDPASYVH